jgi:nucleoside-diphosphate-sugar epimerase
MEERCALVTGAAGFLGSHLCDQLVADGWRVLGIDNLFRGRVENLDVCLKSPRFSFEKLDLLSAADRQQLGRVVRGMGVEYVFHYAAINGTSYFYERPLEVLNVNSDVSRGLIDVLADCPGVRKIVYASSSEVYGDPRIIPTPEEHEIVLRPMADRDSYAAGKALGEFYIRLFAESRGIAWLILRFFNAYGERMDTSGYGQVIPEFIRKLRDDDQFTIIGDGRQTRSFIYVRDHVRIVLAATERARNVILNVGSNDEVEIAYVAQRLHEIAGRRFAPVFLPARPYDHSRRCPSTAKIAAATGMRPEVDLDEGLRLCLEFYDAMGKQ